MLGTFAGDAGTWFGGTDPSEARAVERPVAALRVILATTGLFAITLDPTQPTIYAAAAYAMLAGYVGVSVAILVAVRARQTGRAFAIATHILDVLVAAALMLFTQGPDSPFFVFLSFPLLVAGYRWGMRETLATAGAAILFLGVQAMLIGSPSGGAPPLVLGDINLNRLIMRGVYLVIAGLLVGYLAENEKQRRRERCWERSAGCSDRRARFWSPRIARVAGSTF